MARSVNQKLGPKQEYSKLLNGSAVLDLNKKAVGGVILQVRETTGNFGAPYVIDFDTEVIPGVSSWPCNQTEARKLADMLGPDVDNWGGCAIVLGTCMANNPKLGHEVPSLTVVSAMNAKDTAKKRTSKATIKLPANNAGRSMNGGTKYDEVPF
jgi:hypothetical protein